MPERSPRLALLVAEFPPLGGGGVIRVTKLVKFLSELGWTITVVACDEPAPAAVDETLLAEIPETVSVRRVRGPFRAIGRAAPTTKAIAGTRPMGRRFVGWAKAAVNGLALPDRWAGWAFNVSRMTRTDLGDPDVILSSGPPHSVHLAAARLAARHRVPFVMDMRDDWADNPLFRTRVPWREPIARALERACMRRAAHVVLISELSRDGYVRRFPFLREKTSVITNGFDPDDFVGGGSQRPTRIASRPLEFLHAGSLHGRDDGGPFFRVFGRVAKEDSPLPIRLVFMGSLNTEQRTLAEAAIPAGSVSFESHVPHQVAIRRMRAADVLVVILNAAEGWAGTVTGKLFEYLAARRPILFIGPAGAATELIVASGVGTVADPLDSNATERAIRQAAAMALDPSFTGASEEVLSRFDRRRHAAVWAELLHKAIRGVTPTREAASAGGRAGPVNPSIAQRLLNSRAFDLVMRVARPTFPRQLGVFEALAYPWVGSMEWLRRHAMLIGELERIRVEVGRDTLEVLDFGGGNGSLRHAMRLYGVTKRYRMILADVDAEAITAAPRDGSLVDAVLLALEGPIPLPDRSVDVSVSSDVFEHIPPDMRAYWVGELSRVSRLGQVHTFPADSRDGRWVSTATDRAFDAWYQRKFGHPERWTQEHLSHAEPVVEEMAELLPGASVEGFANHAVWLEMVTNQFSGGFLGRCAFALRYFSRMRARDSSPPFKSCRLTWNRLLPHSVARSDLET